MATAEWIVLSIVVVVALVIGVAPGFGALLLSGTNAVMSVLVTAVGS